MSDRAKIRPMPAAIVRAGRFSCQHRSPDDEECGMAATVVTVSVDEWTGLHTRRYFCNADHAQATCERLESAAKRYANHVNTQRVTRTA